MSKEIELKWCVEFLSAFYVLGLIYLACTQDTFYLTKVGLAWWIIGGMIIVALRLLVKRKADQAQGNLHGSNIHPNHHTMEAGDVTSEFRSSLPLIYVVIGSVLIAMMVVPYDLNESESYWESLGNSLFWLMCCLLLVLGGLRSWKSPYVRFYDELIILNSGWSSVYIPIDLIKAMERKKTKTLFWMFDEAKLSIDHSMIPSSQHADLNVALEVFAKKLTHSLKN